MVTPTNAVDLQTQLAVAMVFSWLFERLKQSSRFPWVTKYTSVLNSAVTALFALLATAGLEWHYTGSLAAGGTFTVSIPALSMLLEFAKNFAIQWGSQHSFYKIALKGDSK